MFFRHCNGNKKSNHDNGDFSGRFYFRGCIYKQGVFFRPDKSLLCLFPMIQIPMIYGKTFSSDEQKEIARLRRELRDAQDALDVLKKAINILGK